MTLIQDMTVTQRQSWLTILADSAVFFWLLQKTTLGFTSLAVEFSMSDFAGIVAGVIVLTVVLHTAISIVFELAARKDEGGKDERDIQIERRGAFWGYRCLQIGVGIVTIGVFMSGTVGTVSPEPMGLSTPVQIIFGLIVVSYIADLMKHAVMLYGYGR